MESLFTSKLLLRSFYLECKSGRSIAERVFHSSYPRQSPLTLHSRQEPVVSNVPESPGSTNLTDSDEQMFL